MRAAPTLELCARSHAEKDERIDAQAEQRPRADTGARCLPSSRGQDQRLTIAREAAFQGSKHRTQERVIDGADDCADQS